MHRALAWLAGQGHEVRCLVGRHRGTPTDGVLYARRDSRGVRDWWRWADVALSQHTGSEPAALLGVETGTPVAHLAHNWHVLDAYEQALPASNLLVWNSEAMADALAPRWPGPSIVARPAVFPDDFPPSTGDLVTQVNLSPLKGGELFWRIAATLPDIRFLAVVGGWGRQLDADGNTHPAPSAATPLTKAAPPNVAVQASTTSIAETVLTRTRILMMPTGAVSESQAGESYGLIAAEAVCAGIPVLATRSPGTAEALGDAAVWCDPADPDQWVAELRRLSDPDEWQAAHERALARRAQLDPTPDLRRLEAALSELCESEAAA